MKKNRWVIISSPRSGSTALENAIYSSISKIYSDKSIKLGEFFHGEYWSYYENIDKTANFIKKETWESPKRIEFYYKIVELIQNYNFGITLRIFPQLHYAKHDYLSFLQILKKSNFTFIKLTRNKLDKIISLSVAQKTNIWQKKVDNFNNIKYEFSDKPLHINPNFKIQIDTTDFIENFYNISLIDFFVESLTSNFQCLDIHYENLVNDCKNLNIPVSDFNYLKIYDYDYTDLIINYSELITLYHDINKFEEKNYG